MLIIRARRVARTGTTAAFAAVVFDNRSGSRDFVVVRQLFQVFTNHYVFRLEVW